MSRAQIVLATLIGYKVLLVAIGFWAQRRTHDNADYFLGGRKLGPWVAAISYAASSSSAWSLLGVSGAHHCRRASPCRRYRRARRRRACRAARRDLAAG